MNKNIEYMVKEKYHYNGCCGGERESCKCVCHQSKRNELEKKINLFWENEELQDAITQYGEWNGQKLEQIKNKVLNEVLNTI